MFPPPIKFCMFPRKTSITSITLLLNEAFSAPLLPVCTNLVCCPRPPPSIQSSIQSTTYVDSCFPRCISFSCTLSRSPLALIYFHFHWSIEFDRGKASRCNRVTKIPPSFAIAPLLSSRNERGRRQHKQARRRRHRHQPRSNQPASTNQPNGYLLCTSCIPLPTLLPSRRHR